MKAVKDNKGYSLIEMIIVIAIIAILSAASVVSMSIIHSAKAKEAAISFESEIAELITKSKNLSCEAKQADGTKVKMPDYMHALKVYKDGNTFYVAKGFYNTATKTYIFDDSVDNDNGGKGVSLSKNVAITFTKTGDTVINDFSVAGSEVYIRINKNGTVVEGDGQFGFYKKNGNEVATVTLRSNGSHDNN